MDKNMNILRKACSLVICFNLLFQQTGFAQIAGSASLTTSGQIDLSGYLSGLKNSLTQDVFRPAHLRYFSYDNLTDNFKLLVEKGDYFKIPNSKSQIPNKSQNPKFQTKEIKETNSPLNTHDLQLKQETNKLLEYFLVGVSLQDDMFWVNLRPDSQDQIIDNWLEKTDVGKIMLEADLQLKKDTAMWTSPETTLGRKYWDKLYKKAAELYGYDNVTIPTLTRPWIVPGEIIVRETKDDGRGTAPSAYIYKATLKVMLEEDYLESQNSKVKSQNYNSKLKIKENLQPTDLRTRELNTYSTQLIREMIIPKLTKEVNSSKRYAGLRQIYYSLILSRWFKMRFGNVGAGLAPARNNAGDFIRKINSSDLSGLTSKTPWSKDTYFKQYQKSFTEGEYNIKEPVFTPTGQVIRSYFSGGLNLGTKDMAINVLSGGNISSAVLNRPETMIMTGNAANLELPDLRLVNNANAAAPRTGEKVSSGINLALAKQVIYNTLVKMKVMTADEFKQIARAVPAWRDVIGRHSAGEILDELARTNWTVKKEGERYFYRPFRLLAQANEQTDMHLLKLLGADGILAGHSEVRKNRRMDNKDVNKLLHQAFEVFGPDSIHIMAMGEPLVMRDDQGNLTEEGWEFLGAQVKEGFKGLTAAQIQKIIIGYEPIWSIGTGKTAKPEQAQEVQAAIRVKLPVEIRDSVIIQYGGSMTPDTAAGLIAQVDVDGGLIGGVSLKKESALALIKAVADISKNRVTTIVFNLKAAFMEASYLTEVMNIFQFIQDNLSDVDFEKIHIGFAVSDTDIPLFNRALKGENPQNLVDLSNESLPNGLELAVSIDSVSTFEPGARTSEITAEALRQAGVKAVIAGHSISDADPRVIRAQAVGLRRVKLNNIVVINNISFLKDQIKDMFEDHLIVIEPVLAREAYAITRDLQGDKQSSSSIDNSSSVWPIGELRNTLDVLENHSGQVRYDSGLDNAPERQIYYSSLWRMDLHYDSFASKKTWVRLRDSDGNERFEISYAGSGALAKSAAEFKNDFIRTIKNRTRVSSSVELIERLEQKFSERGVALSAVAVLTAQKALELDGDDDYFIKPTIVEPDMQIGKNSIDGLTPGGIDFRGSAMNINYWAMGSFKGLDIKLPKLSASELNKINIDSEISQIKKMVSSGISPSGRHIMEVAAACEQKGRMSAYASDLLLCIMGTCELAEVNADESSVDFMTALAFVDSRS